MHIFVVHRKGQVIGVTSVVLTLIFQSNDIVVWHIFFSFCILHFGTGLCSLGASNFVLCYCIVVKSRYMSVER